MKRLIASMTLAAFLMTAGAGIASANDRKAPPPPEGPGYSQQQGDRHEPPRFEKQNDRKAPKLTKAQKKEMKKRRKEMEKRQKEERRAPQDDRRMGPPPRKAPPQNNDHRMGPPPQEGRR